MITDRQTAGKGRSGRNWVGGEGNFQASFALALRCTPAVASQLSLAAGIALHDAIRSLAAASLAPGNAIELKWPNDLLIGRAKCAGILIETLRVAPDGPLAAVIGIGVNLVSHPDLPDRPVTDLSAHGVDVQPKSMLAALRASMDSTIAAWDEGAGFDAVRKHWLKAATPHGTRMSVHGGHGHADQGRVEGAFAGLDADGALLMTDHQGCTSRYTFGDVTLI